MSDTALDITPTSPTPKASQSGSQDKPPSTPNYESWDIRRVNPFAKPERGMSGQVLAKFDLHQEYETHDLLLVLEPALTNVHLGKDMSQMAEVIMQKLPDWNKRARDLELLKMDDDELRRLAVKDKEKSKGPIDSLRGQDRSQFLRYKRTGAGKYEKEIIKRKENIRSLLSVKEGDTLAQDKLDKFIQEIRQQHEWYNLSNKDIQARLEAYVSQEPQHIFETVDEAMYIYQFIEQVEKSAAYQLGYDITSGGTRDFDIDLSQQNIDRIAEKETDDRKKAAIKDIGRRFAMNNWEDFWDWAGTIAWTGWSSYTSAFAAIVANGMAGGVVHPLLATGIGLAGGAVAGPLEVLLTRALSRKLRNWYFKYPEKGQKERGSHFKLSFNPGDLHDPDRRDLGLTSDPIRQLFQNKGSKLTMDFLQRCENFRVDLANGVGFHEPETLAGWIDLSDRVLGEATQGMEIPHRIALAHKIQQILEQEYRKDTGGHKQLEELELEERVKVVTDAFDIISQVEGGETLAPIIKKAMIARMKGIPLDDNLTKALENLAKEIKNGKKVIHPKENPVTLEGKEDELAKKTARRERQTSGQEKYTQLLEQITVQDKTTSEKKDAWDSAKRTKGKESTGTKKGTGEIGIIEAKIETAEGRLKTLKGRLGEKQASGLYDGIIGEQKEIGSQLNILKDEEAGTRSILTGLQQHLTELKLIGVERIPPDADPDLLTYKQNILNEIAILENKNEPPDPRSIKAAENLVRPLTLRRESLDESYRSLGDEIKSVKLEIENIEKSEGILDNLRDQITSNKNEINAAEDLYKTEKSKLDRLIRERNQLLQEVFGLDTALSDFIPPSTEKIGDLTKETIDKVTKLETELKVLKKKKEEGATLTVSEEDLELEKGLNLLVEKRVFESSKYNQLMDDVHTGKIKKEDLSKTFNDEGIKLLIRSIFGIDVDYNLASRILSKGRLAESIMQVWNIEGRATSDAFFAGDEAGLRAYQDNQLIKNEIAGLAKNLSDVQKGTMEGRDDRIRELRHQINNRQIELNNALSILYDTRLASLLAQDRVATGQVLSSTLKKIANDALEGNVFNELLTVSTAGPKTETVTTSQGRVSLTEADKNERTGELNTRGSINAENVGNTGISYEVNIDNTDPEGNMDLSIIVNKDNANIANFPEDRPAYIPAELSYLLYGDAFRRKGVITPTDFNEPILNSINHATRQAAEDAGFPPALLNLLYGPNQTDGKRDIADIMIDLGTFNTAPLPYEQENFSYAGPQLQAYFYEQVSNKRLTIAEINGKIVSLPADRTAATAAGMPAEVLDLIYKPDGTRRDPGEINKITGKITGITDMDRLEEVVSLGAPTVLAEYFYISIGEFFGRLSASDRLNYLKNKFEPVVITGPPGGAGLEAEFENGEIKVYYNTGTAAGRVSCNLIDFIRMTPEKADNVDTNIVSFYNRYPADKERLIREIGKQAIQAMRRVV